MQMTVVCGRRKDFHVGQHPLRRVGVGAVHQGVAVLEAPDAARHAAIDEVNAGACERGRATLRILVIGVAAIDDHIAAGELGPHIFNHQLGRRACRHHQPHDARRRELRGQHTHRIDALDDVLALEVVPCRAVDIESDDAHAGAHEPPRHVAAHPTQPDDSEFHGAAFQNQSRDATAARVNARTPGRWPAWPLG